MPVEGAALFHDLAKMHEDPNAEPEKLNCENKDFSEKFILAKPLPASQNLEKIKTGFKKLGPHVLEAWKTDLGPEKFQKWVSFDLFAGRQVDFLSMYLYANVVSGVFLEDFCRYILLSAKSCINLQGARGYPPEEPASTNLGNMDTDRSSILQVACEHGTFSRRSIGELTSVASQASRCEGVCTCVQWFHGLKRT